MAEYAMPHDAQPIAPPRRRLLVAGVIVLVSFAATALIWRTPPRAAVRQLRPGSIYENTQATVKYVGDTACLRCHGEIAASFRQHPMGQSLFPIAEAPAPEQEARKQPARFESNGLIYSIEYRGNRV